ncbi:hypothetical protein CR513_15919, partial [Mucuna pruriens]
MERWIGQEKPKFQPLAKELEGINLGDEIERKEVQVGKQMPPDLRLRLIGLLKEYMDVFAWSYRDMSGLDLREQLRRMKSDVALKIKEEVEK